MKTKSLIVLLFILLLILGSACTGMSRNTTEEIELSQISLESAGYLSSEETQSSISDLPSEVYSSKESGTASKVLSPEDMPTLRAEWKENIQKENTEITWNTDLLEDARYHLVYYYPQFNGMTKAGIQEKINKDIEEQVKDIYYRMGLTEEEEVPYCWGDYTIAFVNLELLSIVFDETCFWVGARSSDVGTWTLNYDLTTGEYLSLPNYIENGNLLGNTETLGNFYLYNRWWSIFEIQVNSDTAEEFRQLNQKIGLYNDYNENLGDKEFSKELEMGYAQETLDYYNMKSSEERLKSVDHPEIGEKYYHNDAYTFFTSEGIGLIVSVVAGTRSVQIVFFIPYSSFNG